MSADLTPEQFHRAMQANRLQLAGFPTAAKVLVDQLRSEVVPARKCYGRFKLNEADECALETVEFPRHDKN